ncbi:MAG: sulfite exporter TauE/SafE family protein [Planctomycetes bacterium]|nr:sulfite exporter TauE/SafE family protein [Planctomycetota bacterium]
MFHAGLLVLGIIAGVFGGLFGIGGGTIVIPALVYLFGLSQHQAQGTSLAMMVPPVTFLAAWKYYQGGHINLKIAAFIALGFIIGGLIGATVVQPVSDPLLKKGFGVFLLFVGVRMLF